MIAFYYRNKTPIDFLCKREFNPRSLIQWQETLSIELIKTYNYLIFFILSIWQVLWILYFCWIILFWIWLKDLKCMHFYWDAKNLFLDICYIFVELCYFEIGLKCKNFFWDVKNLFLDRWYYIIDLIFIKYFDVILKFWTMCLKYLMLLLIFKLYAY